MIYKEKEIKDLEYSVSKLTGSAIKFTYCSISTDDVELHIEPEQLLKVLSQLVNQAISSGTLKPGLSRFGAKIDDYNEVNITQSFSETQRGNVVCDLVKDDEKIIQDHLDYGSEFAD